MEDCLITLELRIESLESIGRFGDDFFLDTKYRSFFHRIARLGSDLLAEISFEAPNNLDNLAMKFLSNYLEFALQEAQRHYSRSNATIRPTQDFELVGEAIKALREVVRGKLGREYLNPLYFRLFRQVNREERDVAQQRGLFGRYIRWDLLIGAQEAVGWSRVKKQTQRKDVLDILAGVGCFLRDCLVSVWSCDLEIAAPRLEIAALRDQVILLARLFEIRLLRDTLLELFVARRELCGALSRHIEISKFFASSAIARQFEEILFQ